MFKSFRIARTYSSSGSHVHCTILFIFYWVLYTSTIEWFLFLQQLLLHPGAIIESVFSKQIFFYIILIHHDTRFFPKYNTCVILFSYFHGNLRTHSVQDARTPNRSPLLILNCCIILFSMRSVRIGYKYVMHIILLYSETITVVIHAIGE